MSAGRDALGDVELAVTWARASMAPPEVVRVATDLVGLNERAYRVLTRSAGTRVEVLIGEGSSLWVADELVAHATPETIATVPT